eukprot:COSAG01_NODE_52297_length_347_cov_1.459677_1_plen_55_part_01
MQSLGEAATLRRSFDAKRLSRCEGACSSLPSLASLLVDTADGGWSGDVDGDTAAD